MYSHGDALNEDVVFEIGELEKITEQAEELLGCFSSENFSPISASSSVGDRASIAR